MWGDDEGPTEIRLDELAVYNFTERTHTVHVAVRERDELVYWNALTAGAYDSEEDVTGGGPFEDVPTESGRYEVYARYDDQPPDEWVRYAFDSSTSCTVPTIELVVAIGKRNRSIADPPPIYYLSSTEC